MGSRNTTRSSANLHVKADGCEKRLCKKHLCKGLFTEKRKNLFYSHHHAQGGRRWPQWLHVASGDLRGSRVASGSRMWPQGVMGGLGGYGSHGGYRWPCGFVDGLGGYGWPCGVMGNHDGSWVVSGGHS
jgi:hypothetical protein